MAKPAYAFILDTWVIRILSISYIYMQRSPWTANSIKLLNFQVNLANLREKVWIFEFLHIFCANYIAFLEFA